MTEPQPTTVLLADDFKREARTLKKRYRTIETDIQTFIDQLKNGDRPGDQIPRLPDYLIYKVRVKNSDMKRGVGGLPNHLPKPRSHCRPPTPLLQIRS